MTDPAPLNDHEAVYSALQLFGNETRGAPPEWHELEDFQQHRLPVERSAEILSHIANNPVYFQQWLDLCEAGEWILADADTVPAAVTDRHTDTAGGAFSSASADTTSTTSPLATLRNWIAPLFAQPLPVYGGALAAVVLAVLVVPLIRDVGLIDLEGKLERNMALYMAAAPTGDLAAPAKPTTRNLGVIFGPPTATDIEHHYFREGLLQSQNILLGKPEGDWLAWKESMTTSTLDCTKATDSEQCLEAGQDFTRLGEWAMVAHLSCQSPEAFEDAAYWQLQFELYNELQQLPAMAHSKLLQPAMSAHQPTTPDALCFAVAELIKIGQ